MFIPPLVSLLLFYGFFLISCGIAAVWLIGMKAKTALISGGTAGGLIWIMAALISRNVPHATYGALSITAALFIVFCWRSAKTFFRLVTLIQTKDAEAPGKVIAFLIISLMAVISLVSLMLQIVLPTP